MNELLGRILDAHGGMDRWNGYEKVDATIVSGGGFFALKGRLQDSNPRCMTVWLHEERSSVLPYGAPDQRTMFTPERIAIEKLDGTLVAERHAPRDSFAGHQMSTPWDPLHRAYFNGEALWTYLTTPFLLAVDGVLVEETEALRAYFPNSIETPCLEDFFFGGPSAAPPRLSREYRRRFWSVAADFGLCGGERHSSANQASRLYARTGSPADPRNVDGVYRQMAPSTSAIMRSRKDSLRRSHCSGLDPDITLENAEFQLDRVAGKWADDTKRGAADVRKEIDQILQANASAPFGGLAGEKFVNVLKVNLELCKRYGVPK
jgi:hypothetical protein